MDFLKIKNSNITISKKASTRKPTRLRVFILHHQRSLNSIHLHDLCKGLSSLSSPSTQVWSPWSVKKVKKNDPADSTEIAEVIQPQCIFSSGRGGNFSPTKCRDNRLTGDLLSVNHFIYLCFFFSTVFILKVPGGWAKISVSFCLGQGVREAPCIKRGKKKCLSSWFLLDARGKPTACI